MIFSKSFGYVVRGILYIASMREEKHYVQAEEIANALGVPRHFMGKILKKLTKAGVLSSIKGPAGGFAINDDSLKLSLFRLIDFTDGLSTFNNCVLRMMECNAINPCPMHYKMEAVKAELQHILSATTVNDLLEGNKTDFIKSISNNIEPVHIQKA